MKEIDDDTLSRILAFAGPHDCVDLEGIDQVELRAYARGTLDVERRPVIEAHLDDCGYCRLLREEYVDAAPVIVLPRPRRGRAAALGIAAAAAVLLVAVLEPPAPPSFELGPTRGLAAKTMGDAAAPPLRWRVAPSSRVRVALKPSTKAAIPTTATAGVFVQTPQGTYRRADADVRSFRKNDTASFELTFRGSDLLRARGTRDRIALVVATSEAALNELGGVRSIAPGRDGVVDVIFRRVDAVR